MMTISEFALGTGLSVKTLRHYDEQKVLTPTEVDPFTGYRSYSAVQLEDATAIRILRAAGLNLADVRRALASRHDAAEARDVLHRGGGVIDVSHEEPQTDPLNWMAEQLTEQLTHRGCALTGEFWTEFELVRGSEVQVSWCIGIQEPPAGLPDLNG